MFKVLNIWIKERVASRKPSQKHAMVRRELESLFEDDFAAHAQIEKTRKATETAKTIA